MTFLEWAKENQPPIRLQRRIGKKTFREWWSTWYKGQPAHLKRVYAVIGYTPPADSHHSISAVMPYALAAGIPDPNALGIGGHVQPHLASPPVIQGVFINQTSFQRATGGRGHDGNPG